jgi:rhamnulokinase
VKYAFAFDVGASSGRAILGHREGGELVLEEIYRFKTGLIDDGGNHCHWDIDGLFGSLIEGLKKAKDLGKAPYVIGIDTFGVDYALLDEDGRLVPPLVSYRDLRTEGELRSFLTPEKVFMATGIAPQAFDSVYQLSADRRSGKLAKAKELIFLPNYLAYLLTGEYQIERSILSTSAVYDVAKDMYSPLILNELGLKEGFFPKLLEAGDTIGHLKPEIAKEVGFDAEVKAALGHDTAAAFLGSGAKQGEILLSSGTWSLIGCILPEPIVTKEAYEAGFTNELSRKGEVRFLKNIMGMWLINRLKDELGIASFDEIASLSEKGRGYASVFDASDQRLLNPKSMKLAIEGLLKEAAEPLPKDDGELFYCVYHSLAKAYAKAVKEIEALSGRSFGSIRIFGGGSKAKILNELTEKECGLKVNLGPSEATAIGNLLSIGA